MYAAPMYAAPTKAILKWVFTYLCVFACVFNAKRVKKTLELFHQLERHGNVQNEKERKTAMKRFNVSRIIAAFVVVLSISAVFVAAAQDQTPTTLPAYQNNTITVTGLGSAYGAPDVAYVDLGVEVVDANLATAFSQASEQMNAVITAITALGIDRADIQTREINVFQEERYDPQTGPTGERVYRVRNIVRVTVRSAEGAEDASLLESVINDAVNAGANTIYGLSFGILNVDAVESEARLDAVANARRRATELASALGLTVGDAISVREIVGGSAIPYGVGGGGFAMAEMASNAPVSQGQLEVSVSIEVTFALTR